MLSELWFFILMLTGVLCGIGVLSAFWTRPRLRYSTIPRCEACHYDLSATPIGACCPECGGWVRTTTAGGSWLGRYDATIKLWCVITPPVLIAAVEAVFFWPSTDELARSVVTGVFTCAPISIAAAVLASRTRAAELVVLVAAATAGLAAVMTVLLLDLKNSRDPFGETGFLCCSPLIGAGPAGWGAGLGAVALWMRSEYSSR